MKSKREKTAGQIAPIYKLPTEILENIWDNLNLADLSHLSRSCSFFHSSIQQYKKRHSKIISHNLQHLNCDKRIFNGQGEVIYGIATWKDLILTSSRSSVNAWNADTGKILWTYSDKRELSLCEKLWVVDGKAICSGRKYDYDNRIILILDVETGKGVMKKAKLDPELTTVVGNQIIAKLSNGKINCWNLSGKLIKSYQSAATKMSLTPRLLATNLYIADINDKCIKIINREDGNIADVTAIDFIYSAVIVDNLLICGLSGYKSSSPNIIIVDMKQGKIIDEYKAYGLLHHEHPVNGVTENSGAILSVAVKDRYVFMAHESGKVVAVNLHDRTHKVLETLPKGNPFKDSPYLSLQDKYLFIKALETTNHPSSLCIWDVEKMEKVRSIDISTLNGVKWNKGDLLVSAGKSLVKYDFKVSHQKGENLVEETPGKLEHVVRKNCIVA